MTEPNETVGEVSSEALTQAPTESTSVAENGQNVTATEEVKSEEKDSSKGPTPSAPNELKLYVGNLPDNCLREDLETLFAKYGEVSQCDRVKNFAFVHMVGEDNARKAIGALDDSEFMGTHIQVQIAKSKGKPAEDECFHCGNRGHWAKDCTQRSRGSGPYRRSNFGRQDRPAPYSYGPRREPYGRPPPQREYYDYYDRRAAPSRDYAGAPPYRSRSPGGYGERRSPDYSMGYEGYGPPRSGYGVRRY